MDSFDKTLLETTISRLSNEELLVLAIALDEIEHEVEVYFNDDVYKAFDGLSEILNKEYHKRRISESEYKAD